MSKQVITREEMKIMHNVVALSISTIYQWRRKLDQMMIEKSREAISENSYESVIIPIMEAAQDLKEVRNKLGRLSFADKTIVENE